MKRQPISSLKLNAAGAGLVYFCPIICNVKAILAMTASNSGFSKIKAAMEEKPAAVANCMHDSLIASVLGTNVSTARICTA